MRYREAVIKNSYLSNVLFRHHYISKSFFLFEEASGYFAYADIKIINLFLIRKRETASCRKRPSVSDVSAVSVCRLAHKEQFRKRGLNSMANRKPSVTSGLTCYEGRSCIRSFTLCWWR